MEFAASELAYGVEGNAGTFFERADGGTLFLDEITEMPSELQVKLLRVLESGTVTRVGATDSVAVDTRIIAASNRNLADTVAEGTFREDLLYRLNVFPIELPPLRQRAGDVALLAEHFLGVLNARDGDAKRFTARALRRLEQQPWPGNVRELKNLVERLWILADTEIDLDDIPSAVGAAPPPLENAVLDVRVGTGHTPSGASRGRGRPRDGGTSPPRRSLLPRAASPCASSRPTSGSRQGSDASRSSAWLRDWKSAGLMRSSCSAT